MTDSRKKLILQYIEHWRQKDLPAILDLFDPQISYFDMPEKTLISYSELAEYFEEDLEEEGLLIKEIIDLKLVGDNHVFLTTCHREKTNTPPVIEGTELFEIRGHKIISIVDDYSYDEQAYEDEAFNIATLKKLGLTPELVLSLEKQILDHIKDPNCFKDPSFTLQKLSTELSVSRNKVSFVLNRHMGLSFFDLLNKQRVQWVRHCMKSEETTSALLELAFAAGFNSNSVFYKSFKKETGKTPKRYLQDLQKG